jgi:putrescine aminotransferase
MSVGSEKLDSGVTRLVKPSVARGTRFWHPFSNMGLVQGHEFVFTRGEGSYLYDRLGNRYLDLAAGLWYCAVGHGRSEIADAIREQARTLAACSCFDVYASDRTLDRKSVV